jgi:dihydropteroate synthase
VTQPRLTFNGFTTEIDRPLVMGILNLTPDSFSDGGRFNTIKLALNRVHEMRRQGADIIDIGAESTRPGSHSISVEEELDRLLPVLRELPRDRFLISVDSNKPEVQAAAAKTGAHILNDILGGNEELCKVAETHQCGVVSMHTPAPPATMQLHTNYEDVVVAVLNYFQNKHALLQQYDIPRYWVDPGIGFGKTSKQSIKLLRETKRFCGDGWGVLIGASRKSWIGKTFDVEVNQRLGGSLATAIHCVQHGAEILRVHDIQETVQALATAKLLYN